MHFPTLPCTFPHIFPTNQRTAIEKHPRHTYRGEDRCHHYAITVGKYRDYSKMRQELRTRTEYNIIHGLSFFPVSLGVGGAARLLNSEDGVCGNQRSLYRLPAPACASYPTTGSTGRRERARGGPIPPVHLGSRTTDRGAGASERESTGMSGCLLIR